MSLQLLRQRRVLRRDPAESQFLALSSTRLRKAVRLGPTLRRCLSPSASPGRAREMFARVASPPKTRDLNQFKCTGC
jgi:hypothetical protein